MESQLPAPRPSGEIGVSNPQILPTQPETITVSQNIISPERMAGNEIEPQASVQSSPMLPSPSQTTQSPPIQMPIVNPLVLQDDTPVVAADDEVIEKEWVDKAKNIINQTKDNPYQQEKEVSKLQANYLKKRYGKDIKIASD